MPGVLGSIFFLFLASGVAGEIGAFSSTAYKPCYLLRQAPICALEAIEVRMDAFDPLLPQQPNSQVPLLQPVNDVLFKHVHFG